MSNEGDLEVVDDIPTLFFGDFPVCKLGYEEKNYSNIVAMKPKKGDIFLNTYPKCGTTWAQYIIWEILNDGQVPPNTNLMMFNKFPFLEFTGMENIDTLPSPRTFKLHLPFRLTPYTIDAKYISVMRNPFDCCVSFFHHFNEMDMKIHGKILNFDSYFKNFVTGNIPFGSYFEHVISWYEKRNEPNVLFFSYEETKENLENVVLKIAEFLGEEYKTQLKEDNNFMARILKHTSFDYMKENFDFRIAKSMDAFAELGDDYFAHSTDPKMMYDERLFTSVNFYRKGVVGGSKTVLSDAQWQQIDEAIDEKVKDPELRKLMRKTKST